MTEQPRFHGRVLSLFCGPGGMDLGFKQAGLPATLAYDIDKACLKTYSRNHDTARTILADLSNISVKDIVADWRAVHGDTSPLGVIGGPPCQSFSRGNRQQSDDDPRHNLPGHYARIIGGLRKQLDIDFFAFENVPGLIREPHLGRFNAFLARCRRAGFHIYYDTLDAVNFGVPQFRSRVFVVGFNSRKYRDIPFEFPQVKIDRQSTVSDAIGGLPEPALFKRDISVDDINYHPNHWCMAPKSQKFVNGALLRQKVIGRSFRVLEWDRPSYTVAYGNREVHVHPDGHRRLSVFEAMLLQGFPTTYQLQGTLTDQIRLVSEAVSPPVANALACAMLVHMEASKRSLNAMPAFHGIAEPHKL